MDVRLCELRGEKSDGGFWSRNGYKPKSSAHSSIFSKGLSHLINVGVGTENGEVICIGVGYMVVGLGECGDEIVQYGKGYTGT